MTDRALAQSLTAEREFRAMPSEVDVLIDEEIGLLVADFDAQVAALERFGDHNSSN